MELVAHRMNRRAQLATLPFHYGAEIDLRAEGSELVLNHDPFAGGERFSEWLDDYHHGLLVLNIKEAGIESEAIRMVEARGLQRFFLLDVEFPYIHRATRQGEHRIAMRFSEEESIITVEAYAGRAEWAWIDTITKLPLDPDSATRLSPFKTCLVCPERWGRPLEIPSYAKQMRSMNFWPDAVMTSMTHFKTWEQACLTSTPEGKLTP